MKKNRVTGVCIVFCMLLCLMMAPDVVSAENTVDPIRVAVINYPNYIQMSEDGTVTGYAYDYLRDIAKITGWNYEFVEMNFSDALTALENGSIDILPGNQYTEERAEKFDYSSRDMGEGGSVLCVRPDDTRYCYNDYASYGGMKIAALAGSARIQQTEEKLAEYGVTVDFKEFATDEESKQALENGQVDAVLMSSIRCEHNYKILARLDSLSLYFCSSKSRPEIKNGLDQAMEQIHLNNPYYEEQLNQKYYGDIPVQLAYTQEEKEYIAQAGTITVAVSDDLSPIEYYNKKDKSYQGIVPDTFALIAENTGLSFQYVKREKTDTTLEKMKAGEIQLIASIADQESVAEKWNVILTDSYRSNSVSAVINDSVSNYENTDCVVVLKTGYPYLEEIAKEQGYSKLIYADTFEECLKIVKKKQADMSLFPSNCAETLIRKHAYSNLYTYLMPDTDTDYCIGVSKDADPILVSIMNKAIASITSEQQTNLLVTNLSTVNDTLSVRNFLQAHRFSILLLVLLLAAIIILIMMQLAFIRKRTNYQLQEALREAAAASHAKTDFMSRMSHDMRTPMNGILGLAQLSEEEEDKEVLHKNIQQIKESGDYLLSLINDVLDMNKVESGKLELYPQVCDEEQVFQSILTMLKPQIEEKRIDFHFEKVNIDWTYMLLDTRRVKQIFINLISNAIKFTPEGGRIDFIMELVSESEEMIRDKFIVRDSGIGMSEEFLPHVFEPFAQEESVQKGLTGTGLGLSIVKSLVELMGGEIQVKSKRNEGTEFTLYLNFPLAKKSQQKIEKAAVLSEMPEGLQILLCEDHPLNAQIAKRLLEKQGAHITWVENGKCGVDKFSELPQGSFDVILMDIRMPVMDGLTAARTIRNLDRKDAKNIPIIAMTANAFEEDIRECLGAGMNAHIAKPFEPKVLYRTIAEQLADKKESEKEHGQ